MVASSWTGSGDRNGTALIRAMTFHIREPDVVTARIASHEGEDEVERTRNVVPRLTSTLEELSLIHNEKA